MTKTIHADLIRGHVDFAVITIREDEFQAVLKRFSPRTLVLGGRQFYQYHNIRRPDGNTVAVTVVRAFDQGQSVAQSVTRDVIDDLHPRWLVLVGIAGGIAGHEFSLGDVLLASSLHDFSVTAALEDESPQLRTGGGPVHPAVARLLAALPAEQDRLGKWNGIGALGRQKPQLNVPEDIHADCYYGSDVARKNVRNSLQMHFPSSGCARPPLCAVGAVATANVLLKDTALLAVWKQAARQITHIEMEAGGVYRAARDARPHEVPLLCVRGISDIVGFKRDSDWTQFACDAAASFLHALVSKLPLGMFYDEVHKQPQPSHIESGANVCATSAPRTPTLDAIVRAFQKSSWPLLSRVIHPEDRIYREEEKQLTEFFSDGDDRVVCLLGGPGSGKTALLALVAQNAIDAGFATLGIKADILSGDSLDTWGLSELGLKITALDAVKAVSSQSRVLVIVDQLDALAGMVDLKSDRLNGVIEFINQCSRLPKVSVILSCRTFDYFHDARFASLNARTIDLALPTWDGIIAQLSNHGVTAPETFPEQFREVLRTPQHLHVFLDHFRATGNTDSFGSYHLMLDDLWNRSIGTAAERELLDHLTEQLIENEALWAPYVQFEEHHDVVCALESKQILQVEGPRIGFRHQTLLEHAKARLFTKTDKSLCGYILERQDAILVRPTAWAVLRYLRDAHPEKYRVEIEALFAADLRLHMRYLLIDFLGEQRTPEEYEVVLLAERLLTDRDRLRALIAIRGSASWFHALCTSHFPVVMRGPTGDQWPMIGIIGDAWEFAHDACMGLIEEYWLPDREKDELTWRALANMAKWDEHGVDIACRIVRRADASGDRLFWAERLVSVISANRPNLAPRVFVATVSHTTQAANGSAETAKERRPSPLEYTGAWYDLPEVALAAPREFLRDGWPWLVRVCEEFHSGYRSTVVYQYTGSCYSLDEDPSRPGAPILNAFREAIDAVAGSEPEVFVKITEPFWSSENAVVHRLLVRGLCLVACKNPLVGIRYLKGDRRRFALGDYESGEQSDSLRLIREVAPRLPEQQVSQLEEAILSWSIYREGIELLEERREWDREARVRLLDAIPANLQSPHVRKLVQSEKQALPGWELRRQPLRSGWVHQIPPISREEMLTAENDVVLRAINESTEPDRSNRQQTECEGGWEEPGGPLAAGRELAELAKEHPRRAIELIRALVADGKEDVAAIAIHSLPESALDDSEVYRCVHDIASLNPRSEEMRSSIGYLLYRRCRPGAGLSEDLCDQLRYWLSEPWDSAYTVFPPSDSQDDAVEPQQSESVLWSRAGGLLDTDRSFWPLLAATNGYLMRSPADTTQWLDTLEAHLNRNIAESTWAAYCSQLRWIRLEGCDRIRGPALIMQLFARFPRLGLRAEGVRLVANVSDVLSRTFLQSYLDTLQNSGLTMPRQAFGELLTLIAFRDHEHKWAPEALNKEIAAVHADTEREESVAVGIAFAAARLWDESPFRLGCSRLLCQLIPNVTKRVSQAIGTVLWARQDFAADEPTEMLLQKISEHPNSLSGMSMVDLVEHLVVLVPHRRALVLGVCQAILESRGEESALFEAGPQLVKIAMTLQRFPDTRTEGLALLERLLQLGLDDAFRVLRDIDIRPDGTAAREMPHRRRRQRG